MNLNQGETCICLALIIFDCEAIMSVAVQDSSKVLAVRSSLANSTFVRILRYSFSRILSLFITVAISIYLTIVIANMGGYVDQIIKGTIRDHAAQALAANPNIQNLSPDARKTLLEKTI